MDIPSSLDLFILVAAGSLVWLVGGLILGAVEARAGELEDVPKIMLTVGLSLLAAGVAFWLLVSLDYAPATPDNYYNTFLQVFAYSQGFFLVSSKMIKAKGMIQPEPLDKPAPGMRPVARPPTPDSLKVMGPRSEPNSDEG